MPRLAQKKEKLIFIDESHFISMDMWKNYGWYDKGSMPLAFRQNLWKKQSCSLILAIGWMGPVRRIITPHLNGTGVKSNDFIKFLMDLHQKLPMVQHFFWETFFFF